MNEAANEYRTWILSQDAKDWTITCVDDEHLTIESEVATGCVNFYDIDGMIVVELRLEHKQNGESIFFLHFELETLDRAKKLYKEMCQVHAKLIASDVCHVLLCCSCGITTTFFANKLNETAKSLDLDYDFCAMSLEEAKQKGTDYAAVLLAPQVGYQRKSVADALPNTLVIELPASIFGSYDAPAALNLVVNAITGARTAATSDLRMVRFVDHSKFVLAVSYVYRNDEPTLSYCVVKNGEKVHGGMLIRQKADTHILEDLEMTLRVEGYPLEDFDAVGIGVPGLVEDGVVYDPTDEGFERFELAKIMSDRWGVPVFVDNNATAAAAGCYVSQTDWDDVVFHAQTIGEYDCAEGLVIGGLPRAGNKGFAGKLWRLAKNFPLSMDLEDAAWRYDGTLELVTNYLATTICCIAPKAIFVWCDLLPDMELLRNELAKLIPEDAIPELVEVSDYDGLILMGEVALCLQRLSKSE